MCITPLGIRIREHKDLSMDWKTVAVPCGKCPECKTRRVNGWAFRLQQELKVSTRADFITITYDTEYLTIDQDTGYLSVNKKEVQEFIRELRREVTAHWDNLGIEREDQKTIKYFLCAEYAPETFRPHYHAIVFNLPDQYIFDRTWNKGICHYGQVEEASILYTLKYMNKPQLIPTHEGDPREKEFQLMSKKLGENYVNDNSKEWHTADLANRQYLPLKEGRKIAMPRYYKEKLYNESQRRALVHHAAKSAEINLQKKLNMAPDYYTRKYTADQEQFRKFILNKNKSKKS